MTSVKNLFIAIGVIVSVVISFGLVVAGDKIIKISELDSQALLTYSKMFNRVLETGDIAKGMVLEYEVNEDVSDEEVALSINSLLGEYNMRLTGDINMFTKEDALALEVKHARIFSLCSLTIAKKFLNYSHEFGGFMPCRIIMIELGNGKRFLYTMDFSLMIYGGKLLPPELKKLGINVKNAMEGISSRAAQGEL